MKEWFAGLQPRERLTLLLGSGVLLVFLFYTLVWSPLSKNVARLQQQVSEQQDLIDWMRGAADEINTLGRGAGRAVNKVQSGQSLLSLIDSTAKRGKLGEGLKRVKPDGEDKVSVWLDVVIFDDVIVWVESLRKQYGVEIESMIVDSKDEPGKVDVRVVFTGAK